MISIFILMHLLATIHIFAIIDNHTKISYEYYCFSYKNWFYYNTMNKTPIYINTILTYSTIIINIDLSKNSGDF